MVAVYAAIVGVTVNRATLGARSSRTFPLKFEPIFLRLDHAAQVPPGAQKPKARRNPGGVCTATTLHPTSGVSQPVITQRCAFA